VPDRVNAPMYSMQPPRASPHPYGAGRQSNALEVSEGHNPVLAPGKLCDLAIHGGLVEFRQRC
jgi:hypothetical protein